MRRFAVGLILGYVAATAFVYVKHPARKALARCEAALNGDATKVLRFEVDGWTTGATKAITLNREARESQPLSPSRELLSTWREGTRFVLFEDGWHLVEGSECQPKEYNCMN